MPNRRHFLGTLTGASGYLAIGGLAEPKTPSRAHQFCLRFNVPKGTTREEFRAQALKRIQPQFPLPITHVVITCPECQEQYKYLHFTDIPLKDVPCINCKNVTIVRWQEVD